MTATLARPIVTRVPDQSPAPPPGWFPDQDIEDAAIAAFAELLDLPAPERDAAMARLADPRVRTAVAALLQDHDRPAPIVAAMLQRTGSAAESFGGPGTRIGPFLIRDVLGRGGMGIVYRAEQDRPRRQVALKLLTPGTADAETLRRFEREVELLGRLQHPGLCRILGAGYVDVGLGLGETAWYAMELVDGEALTTYARQRQLAVAARCALLVQIADAVQHAHARGIVHRDLKPANVLVADGPDGPIVKVLDFGIAHVMASDATPTAVLTRTGMLLGTLGYMSPEQLAGGRGGIDARSDVWALGVIAYELLVERLPLQLEGLPLAAACRLVTEREPAPLGAIDPRLRGDLSAIVAKAMAKDPGERYESAAAFAADLQRLMRGEAVRARPASAWLQVRRFARRNRLLVGGVVATFVALLVGLIGMAILAARNADLSRQERLARGVAETANEQLRASLYRSQMRLGTEAMLAPGGVARVREIVAAWLPQPGVGDLRGFEWHLLWASCHRELTVAPIDPAADALVWTRDGRLAANHVGGAVLRLAGDLTVLRRYVDATRSVFVSTTSTDGRRFFCATAGGTFTVSDASSGRQLGRFVHGAEVERLCCCGAGVLVAALGTDSRISIWNVDRGERLVQIEGPVTGAMGFAVDGSQFACGWFPGTRGVATVWRTEAWASSGRDFHAASEVPPFQVALSDDARTLATADVRGILRVFDVASGAVTRELAHDDGLRALAFRPDGLALAVGCRNYTVYVHDLTNGRRHELRGHGGIVGAVAWSPDGTRLASLGDDARLRLWDPMQPPVRQQTAIAPVHPIEHGQLLWTADGAAIDVQVEQVTTRWRPATGTLATVDLRPGSATAAPPEPFRFAAIAPRGDAVAVGGARSGPLWLWRGDGWRECRSTFVGDLRGLVWVAGDRLAAIDSTDHIRLLDGSDGAALATRAVPECTLALAAAADGRTLAIGCVDQAVRLWEPGAATMTAFAGHTGHVQAVAFAPDGRRLASGGRDRTVRLWDLGAGAEVGLLPTTEPVVALAWSPEGMRLAALQSDGGIVLWDARHPPR
ncbi:MAG: protein kinase [Planctomycetes bacterium]|nr:protein kinase [Planctomycetota bacterium]